MMTTGCLHFEESIEIKANNKGSFQYKLSIPSDIYHSIKDDGGRDIPHSIFQFFDPKLGSRYFSGESSLSVDRYRVYERKNRIYAKINGSISDMQTALNSKKLGNFSLIERPLDNLSILELGLDDHSTFFQETNNSIKIREIRELLNGTIISLKVSVPDKVIDTSGKIKSKKTVVWEFNASKNDDFLKKKPDIFLSFK